MSNRGSVNVLSAAASEQYALDGDAGVSTVGEAVRRFSKLDTDEGIPENITVRLNNAIVEDFDEVLRNGDAVFIFQSKVVAERGLPGA